jgi:hypothetical protein
MLKWRRIPIGATGFVAMAAVVALLSSQPIPVLAEAPSPSYDVKYKFVTSMFSTNGTLTVRGPLRYDKLVRWEMPIKLAFRGNPQSKDLQTIVSSLKMFSNATPLQFSVDSASPNFILIFVSDPKLRRMQVLDALAAIVGNEARAHSALNLFPDLVSDAPCTMGSANNGGRIQMHIGVISTLASSSSAVDRCIELQIMSGVGFQAYDMSDLYNRRSIESAKVQEIQLEMVRLLYSSRLFPGQPFHEVRKLLLGF